MALLFADSFEHYGTGVASRSNLTAGAYSYLSTFSTDVSSSQARTGNRSLYVSTYYSTAIVAPLRTTHNEIGAAFAIYCVSIPTDTSVSHFRITDDTGGVIYQIAVNASGGLTVERGSGQSAHELGQTDAGILTAQAWHHIEFRSLHDNVVGEIEVRVNGVVALYLTDLDLGTAMPVSFAIYKGTSAPHFYFDDFILWDTTGDTNNTFFGPARVNTGWLESDEPGNEWTVVGAASGVDALTETIPDGDTSYIMAGTVGNTSEFTMPELPPEAVIIAGVYVPVMAKLAVAGIGDMQTSIVSGSDVAEGEIKQLTTAYIYRGDVFEIDPATNAPWSKAGLEAAKLRVEKVA